MIRAGQLPPSDLANLTTIDLAKLKRAMTLAANDAHRRGEKRDPGVDAKWRVVLGMKKLGNRRSSVGS